MKEVRISSQQTAEEYVRIMRRGLRPCRFDLIVWVPIFIWGFYLHILFVLLALLVVFWVGYFYYLRPRYALRSRSAIEEPKTFVFNDEGIITTSESMMLKIDWRRFERSREATDCYFLSNPNRRYSSFVRKSSFASAADEARFRTLLQSHTSSKLLPSRLDVTTSGSP